MSIVHVTYPLWLKVAILGTLLFAGFAIPIARRNTNPLLVCTIPVVLNIALSFVGLANLTRGMSTIGQGYHAAAAGSAEALSVIVFGCFMAAVVSALAAFRLKSLQVSSNAMIISTGAWIVGALFLALNLSLIWYVTQPGRRFSPSLVAATDFGFWSSSLFFVVVALATFAGFSRKSELRSGSRMSFVICASAFGALAAALWQVVSRLADIAMGA